MRELYPTIKNVAKFWGSWIKVLHSPEYNISSLKNKRNRIAGKICINMMLDDEEDYEDFFKTYTVYDFRERLPDVIKMSDKLVHKYIWENNFWEEIVQNNPIEFHNDQKCLFHEHLRYCPRDKDSVANKINSITEVLLDAQFRFLLHLVRPYVFLLGSSTKLRACQWITKLCSIHYNTKCIIAKGVRNDYMTCLVGYLHSNQLLGPFVKYPGDVLIPLPLAAKYQSENVSITDPTHPRTEEFLKSLSFPDEGAFAFIAVTGDLCSSEVNSKNAEHDKMEQNSHDSSITVYPLSMNEHETLKSILKEEYMKNSKAGLNHEENLNKLRIFARNNFENYDNRVVRDALFNICNLLKDCGCEK